LRASLLLALALLAVLLVLRKRDEPAANPANSANDIYRVGSPSWSPDGSRILYYAQKGGKGRIHSMKVDGSDVRMLSAGGGDEGYPSMSPDARTIIYDSDATGQFDIWAMDASGTNQRNLTNHRARDVAASWSPDGSQIAFMSDRDNEPGKFDVYTMNADGLNIRRVTHERTVWFPQYSPDGGTLAFHVGRDVHTARADGSGLRRLTTDPANGMYPSWSPDASRIVFMSWRNGPTELFTMNADGTAQSRLLGMPEGDVIDPRWSPDGTRIVFVLVRGSGSSAAQSIWVVDSDGSTPTQLTGK
jgi:TolB protein